eukprot:1089042-Pyramimonas_sp.AAC.1
MGTHRDWPSVVCSEQWVCSAEHALLVVGRICGGLPSPALLILFTIRWEDCEGSDPEHDAPEPGR